jgi:hypothetical protein
VEGLMMKKIISTLVLMAGLIVGFGAVTQAQTNPLACEAGVMLRANNVIIDAGTYTGPTVVDWNNDGKKDLLVASKTDAYEGKVFLYLNVGTDASPSFSGYTILESNGTFINLYNVFPGS